MRMLGIMPDRARPYPPGMGTTIVIVGSPTALGGHLGGMERTPAELRRLGLVERLAARPGLAGASWRMPATRERPRLGARPGPPSEEPRAHLRLPAAPRRPRRERPRRRRGPGARLLVVGGDCTSHAGALAGLRRARPGLRLGLAWFDAHGDFNVPDTTPSGNVWGMPFAMACGQAMPDLLAACDAPTVREADAALLGGQVLDEQESRTLASSGVAQFGAGMLGDPAGRAALRGWAETVAGRIDGWYVAFDLDALDEAGGWALMMPEPGGLALETALDAVRIVAATGPVLGFGGPRSGSAPAAIPADDGCAGRPRGGRAGLITPTITRSAAIVRNASSASPVPVSSQLGLAPASTDRAHCRRRPRPAPRSDRRRRPCPRRCRPARTPRSWSRTRLP